MGLRSSSTSAAAVPTAEGEVDIEGSVERFVESSTTFTTPPTGDRRPEPPPAEPGDTRPPLPARWRLALNVV